MNLVSDEEEYLTCLDKDEWPHEHLGDPIEGFGITYRLQKYTNPDISNLMEFLNGREFANALKRKFEIDGWTTTNIISAIQKNLTKYEISPHIIRPRIPGLIS